MGICVSKGDDDRINDEIEENLRRDRKADAFVVKMLLLGAGESGKSTILKQMKMIHSNGYTEAEKESFREIIFSNVIQSMKVLMDAMNDLEIPLGDAKNEPAKEKVESAPHQLDATTQFPVELATAIKDLWVDAGVQVAFERRSEFQLNDSAPYFFQAIDRISGSGYLPTDQDILRSRVKTTGIIESTFIIGKVTYKMFDVGGQRSERKKWIHCFENVTAIVFLVAISEYDQVLIEDESVNRMQEALTLFDSICNSRWFVKTSMILFLNKIDLFRIKITKVPINKFFPDYRGGEDYDAGCEYFKNKFVALNRSESKEIYSHFTCGTDTSQIRVIMNAVTDIIRNKLLQEGGLI